MMYDFPVSVQIYLTVLTVLLGFVMGSALNCLAYRLARNEKWSGGRSACPQCGHTLSALDLVPVFSWLFLGGKCRYCKAKIPVRYLLAELLLGTCYGLLLWRFGLTWQTLLYLIFTSCLFCLSLVDLDIQIIPDRFLIIAAAVRIVYLAVFEGFAALGKAFLPALALGGGILLLSLLMDKILKKDSMGGGDIKLLAVLGLYFDFANALLLLVFACAAGLVIALLLNRSHTEKTFPFGPALSIAAFLTLLFGQQIVQWYLRLFLG